MAVAGVGTKVVTLAVLKVARADFLVVAQGLASFMAGSKAASLCCHVRRIFVVDPAQAAQTVGNAVAVVDRSGPHHEPLGQLIA